jgi:citrate synthase
MHENLIILASIIEIIVCSPDSDASNSKPVIHHHTNNAWLEITTQFIQDNTRQSLEYPESTYSEAQYIYSLIRQDKVVESSDPLCSKLLDALRVLYMTHEIKPSFLYVANNKV